MRIDSNNATSNSQNTNDALHSRCQPGKIAIILTTATFCIVAGCKQPTTNTHSDKSLHNVIMYPGGNRLGRAKSLIRSGADLNEYRGGITPAMRAVSWEGQYNLAIEIIRSGARIDLLQQDSAMRLGHHLELERRHRSVAWTPQQRKDYTTLVSELERRGESFEAIRSDFDYWSTIYRGSFEEATRRRKQTAQFAHARFHAAEDFANKHAPKTFIRETGIDSAQKLQAVSTQHRLQTVKSRNFENNPILAFLHATSPASKPTQKLHRLLQDPQDNSLRELQGLIDQGASVNHLLLTGEPPAILAVQRRKFAVAAALVRAGADLSLPKWDRKTGQITRLKLIHYVDRYSEVIEQYPPEQRQAYAELVEELAKRGERLEDVKDERHFWDQPLGD